MTPELETLERVLAEIFREVSTAARLADMAGLDVVQIDRTGSSADVWHSIITMAMQDGVLDGLIERAKQERPRNAELAAAWKAYQAAQLPAPSKPKRPPRGQAGDMSDSYRTDNRIDALQKEVADLRAQLAELKSTLSFMISQNNALSDQNKAILRVLDEQNHRTDNVKLPGSPLTYIVGLLLLVLSVYLIVYLGGHV